MPARSTYAWHAYLHYTGPRYADNTSQRLFLLVDVTIASVQSPVTVLRELFESQCASNVSYLTLPTRFYANHSTVYRQVLRLQGLIEVYMKVGDCI